jgi:hypothetical protein
MAENETTQMVVVAPSQQTALENVQEFSVEEVVAMTNKVKAIMQRIMVRDVHYGIIPGCKKPSLYQAGAEKLCLAFRLKPSYVVIPIDLPTGHREYTVTCTLTHIPTSRIFGEGIGSCSTMETKYRYRGEGRQCPKCGQPTIIKGRDDFGGGWLCYAKKGGCGVKFKDGDPEIEKQEGGKIENPDIADAYNTVIQIACKRAYVKATRSSTAASDIFTDTIGDPEDPQGDGEPHANGQKQSVQQPRRASEKPTDQQQSGASEADHRKELAQVCFNLATEGKCVKADAQYKNFTLDDAFEGTDAGELAVMICVELSSFWSDKDKKVVPGKSANELKGKWLESTLRRAKELVESAQSSD